MISLKIVHMIAFILLVVGGLNWGIQGAFMVNVVEKILGTGMLVMVVYVLVGLAAIFEVVTHKWNCKQCASGMSPMNKM